MVIIVLLLKMIRRWEVWGRLIYVKVSKEQQELGIMFISSFFHFALLLIAFL